MKETSITRAEVTKRKLRNQNCDTCLFGVFKNINHRWCSQREQKPKEYFCEKYHRSDDDLALSTKAIAKELLKNSHKLDLIKQIFPSTLFGK